VRVSRVVEPRKENREVYREKYSRYGKYVEALRGAWEETCGK